MSIKRTIGAPNEINIKQKVCTTEVMHTEKRKLRLLSHKHIGAEIFILKDSGVCIFAKTHTSLSMPKKGYNIPLRKNTPATNYSVCVTDVL